MTTFTSSLPDHMLKRLADALEVTTDYLMSGSADDLADESIADKELLTFITPVAASAENIERDRSEEHVCPGKFPGDALCRKIGAQIGEGEALGIVCRAKRDVEITGGHHAGPRKADSTALQAQGRAGQFT